MPRSIAWTSLLEHFSSVLVSGVTLHLAAAWRIEGADAGRCSKEQYRRRPTLRKMRTFRLFLDLVTQKCHAVFERGGLDQLQVLPILENARSLAA
jgi:hypothetical protein